MINYQRTSMRRWSAVVLLAGILFTVASTISSCVKPPEPWNHPELNQYDVNCNWLGLGYDLVYLNLDSYTEPAFPNPDLAISPVVFALQRGDETITAINGKTFYLPEGVSGYPGTNQSRFRDEVEEISSGYAYLKSMEGDVSFSVGVKKIFSASGSAKFKELDERTRDSSHKTWRQTAFVEGHRLQIDLDNPGDLQLSARFKDDVSALGRSLDFSTFIQRWGTHFSSQITYGGRAFLEVTMSQEDLRDSKLSAMSFEANVSGVLKKVSLGMSGKYDQLKKEITTSQTIEQNIKSYADGGDGTLFMPDVPDSVNQWATSVRENPGIYKLGLASYDVLLTSAFFPEDKNIGSKQEKLRREIESYLSQHEVTDPGPGNYGAAAAPVFSIQHATSRKCWHPQGGSPTPEPNTPLVLHEGCNEERLKFRLLPDGSLQHVMSGLCVHPKDGTVRSDIELVLHPGCVSTDREGYRYDNDKLDKRLQIGFEKVQAGGAGLIFSEALPEKRMCVHPQGGEENPGNGTST